MWATIALLVLAAVLGLFGTGLLTDASETGSGSPSVKVRFDRFTRLQSENELIVEVSNPPPGPIETVEIEISRGLLADLHITEVLPDPESVTTLDDYYVYEFAVRDWTETVSFHFEYRSDHWARVRGEVTAIAGEARSETVTISQFVFP